MVFTFTAYVLEMDVMKIWETYDRLYNTPLYAIRFDDKWLAIDNAQDKESWKPYLTDNVQEAFSNDCPHCAVELAHACLIGGHIPKYKNWINYGSTVPIVIDLVPNLYRYSPN